MIRHTWRATHCASEPRSGQTASRSPGFRRHTGACILTPWEQLRAAQLRSHGADHFKPRPNVFERLRHILTQTRRNTPPQSGHACWAGAIVSVSRRSSAGNGRRAGLLAACCFSARQSPAQWAVVPRRPGWLPSLPAAVLAVGCRGCTSPERGPKCTRFSLRMSSYRLSITVVRETISDCWVSTSALKDCASSMSGSGSCVLRGLGISAAFIPRLCHIHLTER